MKGLSSHERGEHAVSSRGSWRALILSCVAGLVAAGAHAATSPGAAAAPAEGLDAESVTYLVRLAIECVHREYPNKIAHVMSSDADVRPPRELTPAFFGCYDWHSAVHGHWLLARAANRYPDLPIAAEARAALALSLSEQNIATEVAYLRGEGRESFERPYGLAWLLQLAAELHGWRDPQAQRWAAILAPLEQESALRLKTWLPKLAYPIRIGEHAQTAFAFSLIWDWAIATGDVEMRRLLQNKAEEFYLRDRSCPLAYEPSGQDFLSPCLAEADFMRRVLGPDAFDGWLSVFLRKIPRSGSTKWLRPAVVTDRSDPKLAHLDGLNLSRAWMLEGIAAGLPPDDRRIRALRATAREHRAVSWIAVTSGHYVGSHWLGTFAFYGMPRSSGL
jgi:hypothetical protein